MIFDDDMFADRVKRVGIESVFVGSGKTFVQFEIEDFKTESLGGLDF
jgi:hypothetical protein